MEPSMPLLWQWIGFTLTAIGAVLTIWAVIQATGARAAAEGARRAATTLGQISKLQEIQLDFEELEQMLLRGDYAAIDAKSKRFEARIAGFRAEAYNQIGVDERESLQRAIVQLQNLAKAAIEMDTADERRNRRLKDGCNRVRVEIQVIIAHHNRRLSEMR